MSRQTNGHSSSDLGGPDGKNGKDDSNGDEISSRGDKKEIQENNGNENSDLTKEQLDNKSSEDVSADQKNEEDVEPPLHQPANAATNSDLIKAKVERRRLEAIALKNQTKEKKKSDEGGQNEMSSHKQDLMKAKLGNKPFEDVFANQKKKKNVGGSNRYQPQLRHPENLATNPQMVMEFERCRLEAISRRNKMKEKNKSDEGSRNETSSHKTNLMKAQLGNKSSEIVFTDQKQQEDVEPPLHQPANAAMNPDLIKAQFERCRLEAIARRNQMKEMKQSETSQQKPTAPSSNLNSDYMKAEFERHRQEAIARRNEKKKIDETSHNPAAPAPTSDSDLLKAEYENHRLQAISRRNQMKQQKDEEAEMQRNVRKVIEDLPIEVSLEDFPPKSNSFHPASAPIDIAPSIDPRILVKGRVSLSVDDDKSWMKKDILDNEVWAAGYMSSDDEDVEKKREDRAKEEHYCEEAESLRFFLKNGYHRAEKPLASLQLKIVPPSAPLKNDWNSDSYLQNGEGSSSGTKTKQVNFEELAKSLLAKSGNTAQRPKIVDQYLGPSNGNGPATSGAYRYPNMGANLGNQQNTVRRPNIVDQYLGLSNGNGPSSSGAYRYPNMGANLGNQQNTVRRPNIVDHYLPPSNGNGPSTSGTARHSNGGANYGNQMSSNFNNQQQASSAQVNKTCNGRKGTVAKPTETSSSTLPTKNVDYSKLKDYELFQDDDEDDDDDDYDYDDDDY